MRIQAEDRLQRQHRESGWWSDSCQARIARTGWRTAAAQCPHNRDAGDGGGRPPVPRTGQAERRRRQEETGDCRKPLRSYYRQSVTTSGRTDADRPSRAALAWVRYQCHGCVPYRALPPCTTLNRKNSRGTKTHRPVGETSQAFWRVFCAVAPRKSPLHPIPLFCGSVVSLSDCSRETMSVMQRCGKRALRSSRHTSTSPGGLWPRGRRQRSEPPPGGQSWPCPPQPRAHAAPAMRTADCARHAESATKTRAHRLEDRRRDAART